ncbi:MAG: hypothetical protein ACC742_06240 [Thermoanaerobaculales bacterium]
MNLNSLHFSPGCVAITAALLFLIPGCRSTSGVADLSIQELESGRDHLARPLPGDPAALYRLQVPSSGGLRLVVRTSGGQGRLTVSEPFGSAVSLTAWTASDPPVFFDLREGCRLDAADMSQVLGVRALPLPAAVRLLGGRLPAEPGDSVSVRDGGRLVVEGRGWAAVVAIEADPWRVVSVEEERADGEPGWRIVLSRHTSSVPGLLRVEQASGRWAKLELVRLEWTDGDDLPALPDLPLCLPPKTSDSHRGSQ